jgi:hypothetical protein
MISSNTNYIDGQTGNFTKKEPGEGEGTKKVCPRMGRPEYLGRE